MRGTTGRPSADASWRLSIRDQSLCVASVCLPGLKMKLTQINTIIKTAALLLLAVCIKDKVQPGAYPDKRTVFV
jgi:hypothetical protein